MKNRKAIFILNLLQDVNVLRPLIYLASSDLKLSTELIITDGFSKRDSAAIWRKEISEIVKDTRSLTFFVKDDFESYKVLEGKSGVLFAGSESDLTAHAPTHNLLGIASSDFLTVTLQHGYECVGFLQSKQHIIAHGKNITFGADVVCGWSNIEKLTTMADSQKSKLLVTGPTSVLQMATKQRKKPYGIVCENLHSVRLSASGDMKEGFMEMFDNFCGQLNKRNIKVALRPHPGGQYVLKNNVKLAKNVEINNHPMYKVDLSQFAYGVSAPSSVVIDMILAEIPVAVWRDSDGVMDTDNYLGLAQVSTVNDLLEFEADATRNPNKYISRQGDFLDRARLEVDPEFVYGQYKGLIEAGTKSSFLEVSNIERAAYNDNERVVFVANDNIPTFQLSFIKPLAKLIKNGDLECQLITEKEMREDYPFDVNGALSCNSLQLKLEQLRPKLIVFCRYSGPNAVFIRLWAKQNKIPVVYHIDDDLLTIPVNIGSAKFRYHNRKERLHTVRYLLDNADLIYSSTKNIQKRLEQLNIKTPKFTGDIYCSGAIINQYEEKPTQLIGYMASADHAHNLKLILPALCCILDKYEQVRFELFGSIQLPEELIRFGSRISVAPPIADYNNFLREFAARNWDVGLCPLVPIPFNKMKAETKWVEYSSCGLAVIASKETAYDECCDNACGILAESEKDWFDAMDKLIVDVQFKSKIVRNAQTKISEKYSIEALRGQVLTAFKLAKESIVEG